MAAGLRFGIEHAATHVRCASVAVVAASLGNNHEALLSTGEDEMKNHAPISALVRCSRESGGVFCD